VNLTAKKIAALSLCRRLKSRAGFTLIEVIVATGIFSVAVLGLAVGAITITKANKTSQFHTIATNMAQDMAEQLKATSVSFVTSCSSSCETAPSIQGVTFTRKWVVTTNSPSAGINKIDVTVSWTDYAAHSVTVTSAMPQS
jgi:prepilin-type N-terminal cleavage/methylation domain-containing protein